MQVILSVLLAQTGGPDPAYAIFGQVGFAAIAGFAVKLYYSERADRKEAQAETKLARAETLELAKLLFPLVEEGTSTMERVLEAMDKQVDRAQTQPAAQLDQVVRELHEAAASLRDRLPARRTGKT